MSFFYNEGTNKSWVRIQYIHVKSQASNFLDRFSPGPDIWILTFNVILQKMTKIEKRHEWSYGAIKILHDRF